MQLVGHVQFCGDSGFLFSSKYNFTYFVAFNNFRIRVEFEQSLRSHMRKSAKREEKFDL
jgi:hypothetical protein